MTFYPFFYEHRFHLTALSGMKSEPFAKESRCLSTWATRSILTDSGSFTPLSTVAIGVIIFG